MWLNYENNILLCYNFFKVDDCMKNKIFIVILFLLLISRIDVYASESRKLKVLVIEINPILSTIENKQLYVNNNGHPYVSEYFNQDRSKAFLELKSDLEEVSHNYLDIEIVKNEYLNEFPTYTKEINLVNGTKAKRYDEETYITMSRSRASRDVGSWIDMVYYPNYKPAEYSFDYNYIIEKFDLINRKNNGEFDQVWLNTIDPASTFETIMVGDKAFWINGTPLTYDCDNFIILNISISRRDANLHALSHGIEGIMNMVFNREVVDYSKRYNDLTDETYDNLTLWEKFNLSSYQINGNYAGVGNVHFPFNAEKDYDYSNERKVYSNWESWLDYPELSLEQKLSDSSSWLDFGPNSHFKKEDKFADRMYIRFWLYLFPHVDGFSSDGFYNNWWKYICDMDFVQSITTTKDKNIDLELNKSFKINFILNYYSGKKEVVNTIVNDDNINIIGDSIKIVDGGIKGTKYGKSIVTIYRDGSSISYTIDVVPKQTNSFQLIVLSIIISLSVILFIFVIFVIYFRKNKKTY